MEGPDLSAMSEIWEDLAVTEMRLQLMSTLVKIKVGFADIEEFNLGLKGNLKNQQSTKLSEMQNKKFVRVAMEVKMRDEQMEKKKKMKNREDARTTLSKKLGKNTKTYRSTIRKFRDAALEKKAEFREKYNTKLEHLKFKYREDEEEKLDNIPKEMQEYASLSIFDRDNFDKIEILSYEVIRVGDVELSPKEEKVLKMHPKFSTMDTLQE